MESKEKDDTAVNKKDYRERYGKNRLRWKKYSKKGLRIIM